MKPIAIGRRPDAVPFEWGWGSALWGARVLGILLCGPIVSGASDAFSEIVPEFDIRLETISSGFDKKTCWVHPRAGAIPGDPPSVVLTMQRLLLTGSDVFGPLCEMRTDDLGATWSGPIEHGATLGHREEPGGIVVGACDFWPKWHAKSGRLLGIGHTVRYSGNRVIPVRPRETCYSVYDPRARSWTAWDTLEMGDAKRFYNAGAGCAQRVDLPDGGILLPIYFKSESEKMAKVTVLRCGFDGGRLTMVGQGNVLAVDTDRGLGEPSLTCFRGRYYLTLRHDKAGYVSTSADGLNFTAPTAWTWDDGSELGNYNTQQHWVTHDDALFLVYTRRGADNDHVFRHRAPLFIARVNPDGPCVLRGTERVLVPERGARLGNFGVTEVNENETWVTVAEWMQTNPPNPYDFTACMKHGSDNAVFVARIRWKTPNKSWNRH
ncbi:MAG TPA: exo-alpha-sialidase [Verrucomicrobiae bacterium]|nr:exo-alpha-sialidase [Verrucomicrobiae bacterium]